MEGPVRAPVQQLNDYLYSQVIILRVVGGNKRFNCKNCLHRSSETASLGFDWRREGLQLLRDEQETRGPGRD